METEQHAANKGAMPSRAFDLSGLFRSVGCFVIVLRSDFLHRKMTPAESEPASGESMHAHATISQVTGLQIDTISSQPPPLSLAHCWSQTLTTLVD